MELYKLQLVFKPSIKTYELVSEILGVIPNDEDFSLYPNGIPDSWEYEIPPEKTCTINYFLNILERNYHELLCCCGIDRENISIWYYYFYDEQCNMQFNPSIMKRMGENEITFCVSCYNKN